MNGDSGTFIKKKWDYIQIRYDDGTCTDIYKKDLDKIEGIEDVIDALIQGKELVRKLQNILK